jgi:hypothetical protein
MTKLKLRTQSAKVRAFFRGLLIPAPRKNRLPAGRCACHEPSVRWCTRHGRPLKIAS